MKIPETDKMLKVNESEFPRNFEILRDYTGIPFECYQDSESKVHAIFKYNKKPLATEPDYPLFIILRFCLNADKDHSKKAIHILYNSRIVRKIYSENVELIIPNIHIMKSKNYTEEKLNEFGNGKHIIELKNQYEYRDEFLKELNNSCIVMIRESMREIIRLQNLFLAMFNEQFLVIQNTILNTVKEETSSQSIAVKIIKIYRQVFKLFKSVQIIGAIYPDQQSFPQRICEEILKPFHTLLKEIHLLVNISNPNIKIMVGKCRDYFCVRLNEFLSTAGSVIEGFNFKVEDPLWKLPSFLKLHLEALEFSDNIKKENTDYIKKVLSHLKKNVNLEIKDLEQIPLLQSTYKGYLRVGEPATALNYFDTMVSIYKDFNSKRRIPFLAFTAEDIHDLFSSLLEEKIMHASEVIKKANDLKNFIEKLNKNLLTADIRKKYNPQMQIILANFGEKVFSAQSECLKKIIAAAEDSLLSSKLEKPKKEKLKKEKPKQEKLINETVPVNPPMSHKKDLIPTTVPCSSPPSNLLSIPEPAPTIRISAEQRRKEKAEKIRRFQEKAISETAPIIPEEKEKIYTIKTKKGKKHISVIIANALVKNLPIGCLPVAIKLLEKARRGTKAKDISRVNNNDRGKFTDLPDNVTHKISFKMNEIGPFKGHFYYLFAHPEKRDNEDLLVFSESRSIRTP